MEQSTPNKTSYILFKRREELKHAAFVNRKVCDDVVHFIRDHKNKLTQKIGTPHEQ